MPIRAWISAYLALRAAPSGIAREVYPAPSGSCAAVLPNVFPGAGTDSSFQPRKR